MTGIFYVNIALKETTDYKKKGTDEIVKLYTFVDNEGNLMEPITLPTPLECEPNTPCVAKLVLKQGRNRKTGEYYNRWTFESVKVRQ